MSAADPRARRAALTARLRRYPTACTSAYCGYISTDAECMTCQSRPALDEFRAWAEAYKAKPVDPIWTPNLYAPTS